MQELLITILCLIPNNYCVKASEYMNINIFFNQIIEKNKPQILWTKRESYDSNIINRFFKTSNSPIYKITKEKKSTKVSEIKGSAVIRDILKIDDNDYLIISSLLPKVFHWNLKNNLIKEIHLEKNNFEYLNGVSLNNKAYVTGFFINGSDGLPKSINKVFLFSKCQNGVCVEEINVNPSGKIVRGSFSPCWPVVL